ncbi:MAG: type II toxin-antitoxin system HicB family antitoxin [Candidatus Aminicenantes bacterium]|nr:type II toxin-antitoxin system HicB family antitoxin [Candidatus Aminicenantes bacterium]
MIRPKSVSLNRYTYRITWSEDDNEYIGLCAEFPSLSWLSQNPGSALKGIMSVVEDVCDDMTKNGEFLPQPLSTKSYSGRFVVRIPPESHRALTIKAAEEGISLNRLISDKLSR